MHNGLAYIIINLEKGVCVVKKIFPVISFLMIFFAFLAMQIAQDIAPSHANKVTTYQDKVVFFENLYKKTQFKIKNKKIKISKVKEPIVVISFWASWCAPCLKEFPSLKKLNKYYDGKILTIGINTDESNSLNKIKEIQKKYKLNFSSISDEKGLRTNQFMVDNIPFTLTFVKGKLIHLSEETHDFMNAQYLEKIQAAL